MATMETALPRAASIEKTEEKRMSERKMRSWRDPKAAIEESKTEHGK